MEIYFATGNQNKFQEAKDILKIPELKHFLFKHVEIRSDSIEEISKDAVSHAYDQLKKPVFVEDTGLFIDSLNGFPGTYSAWALKKIGVDGILRLLEGKERKASFQTVIAYHDGEKIHSFHGRCDGQISTEIKGDSGFGYDPIFIPAGHSTTFAQNIALKSKLSHRYNSLLKMLEYLKSTS